MVSRQSANNPGHQPLHKAVGLLAGCIMVIFGTWIGLRPETILIRTLVVCGATTFLTRLLMNVINSANSAADE